MARAVILYDAECPFCRWSLGRILAWDRRGRLRPVPLQDPEADRLLGGMDRTAKMASWHLVTPDGRVTSGGDAVRPLSELLPGAAPIGRVASAFPGLTRAAYRWVSEHRRFLADTLHMRSP